MQGAARELLGPAACALPLPLWPPALFSGNTRIKEGGVRCLSRLLDPLPVTTLPQLCPRPRVTSSQGDRNCVLREGSPVRPGRDRASRLGAAVFHLGGLPDGSLQEAAWGLVCRWRRGDLSVLAELQSARPAQLSELGGLMGSSSRRCKDVCGLGSLGAGGWKHKGLVGIGETAAAHWDSADLSGVGVDTGLFACPGGFA